MKQALMLIVYVAGVIAPALLFAMSEGRLIGGDLGRFAAYSVCCAWGVPWTAVFFGPLHDLFRKWGMMP